MPTFMMASSREFPAFMKNMTRLDVLISNREIVRKVAFRVSVEPALQTAWLFQ